MRKKPKVLLTALVLIVLVFSLACGRDATIEFERKVPPTFTRSGNGQLAWIEVTDLTPGEVSVYAPERIVWKIKAENPISAWRVPKFTYGVIPYGFVQELPAVGTPPPLAAEKPYRVEAATSAKVDSLIFLIRGSNSLKVIQTHNGEYYLETSEIFKQ